MLTYIFMYAPLYGRTSEAINVKFPSFKHMAKGEFEDPLTIRLHRMEG